MSQVPQNGDDILLSIATQTSTITPKPSEEAKPTVVNATTEGNTVVEPVSTTEPTSAKSEGTNDATKESKTTPVSLETIDDWDSDPNLPAVTTEPVIGYDFSSLGKTIGIEAKSDQDIVSEFKKLKEQNEELVKASPAKDLFANDVLQKANEIAKNNGDYLGFLGIAAIDFDSVPARDLLEDEIRTYYADTPENEQKIQSYLDSLDETDVEMRGAQIRSARKQEQDYEKNKLIQDSQARHQKALQEKQLMDKKVADELAAMKDVNGFVLKPNHKKAIYEDITTGNAYDKLFFSDGKFDPAKAIKTMFIVEQHEKMLQYYKTKAKNEGKRDIISNITNAELDRPGSVVSQSEPRSAMDMYLDSLKSGK